MTNKSAIAYVNFQEYQQIKKFVILEINLSVAWCNIFCKLLRIFFPGDGLLQTLCVKQKNERFFMEK